MRDEVLPSSLMSLIPHTLLSDLDGHCGHVIRRWPGVTELLHLFENPVHNSLRRFVRQPIDDVHHALPAELLILVIGRFVDAVRAEYEDVADVRSNASSSYDVPGNDPSGMPATHRRETPSCRRIGYGSPELAITSWRFLRSNDA